MSANPERFTWRRGAIDISQCVECKHGSTGSACRAFLLGIPDRILENNHDHRKPYPGDNGIRFEPIGEGEAE